MDAMDEVAGRAQRAVGRQGMTGGSCPICGSSELVEANGRPAARCRKCGAYERTRLMWIVLETVLRGHQGRLDVLHFAPEKGLAQRLSALAGGGYRAFDFDPSGFRIDGVAVEQFDLCTDAQGLQEQSADLVVHSHVLEHVPCAVGGVVASLNAALRPGGYHVFCVPVVGMTFDEDLDVAVSDDERTRRFGQSDHVRRFGRKDARATFTQMFGEDVHFSRLAIFDPRRLIDAAIPLDALTETSSHTVFAWRKPFDHSSVA